MPWSRFLAAVAISLVVLSGCGGDDSSAQTNTSRAPVVSDQAEVVVFGLAVVSNGAPAADVGLVTDLSTRLLDPDENEKADSPSVEAQLTNETATVLVVPSDELRAEYDPSTATLVLGGVTPKNRIAALGHIGALLHRHGWSQVFDDLYGIRVGSDLAHAMDRARGGQFAVPPESYPAGAWFTQTRQNCDYECQILEYFRHVHMTLLGEYEDESVCRSLQRTWQVCTPEALQAKDPLAFEAFTEREAGLVDLQP
jgi:hypothetical protein